MIKFSLNGVDMSDDDLNIVVTKNRATGEEEVRLNNGAEEIATSNFYDTIDVMINITSNDNLKEIYEETKTMESCIDKINNAFAVIQGELDIIREKHESLYEDYLDICGSNIKRDENETEAIRKIIMQDPKKFNNISAREVSLTYMVDKLIELYQKEKAKRFTED